MSSDSTHICPRCKRELPLTSEFWHKHKGRKSGFSHKCKDCSNELLKEWNKNNPEKSREHSKKKASRHATEANARAKAWYENNKEYASERNRNYRREHSDRIKAQKKDRRLKNPEHFRQLAQASYQRNRTLFLMHTKRRHNRIKGAGGKHTAVEIRALYQQQNGRCFHCNADLSVVAYEEDHWIAVSRGGNDNIENIRLLCPTCNRSKGNKFPHEWHPEKYPPPTSD